MTRLVLACAASGVAVVATQGMGQDTAVTEPPAVTPADARAHVGARARVEFAVASGRLMADRGVCFLNSMKNHRDAGNFTVVIFRTGLTRLAEAGIDDPSDHFAGRTIRVLGTVSERDGRPQIVVETPDQIEVVEQSR